MTTHPAYPRTRAVTLATALALTFGPGGLLPLGVAMAATRRGTVAPSSAPVTLNFVNADIEGVARAVSAIVHRQILVDPRVKGTVTLYSEQPISARDAYLNFLSALRGQGFALVEVAGLLKIVPEADAKLQTGTVEVGNRGTRSGDQVLTQIFKLQYENVNSMVTVLRPLISPNNTINANPSTNSLVITDYADNLRRIGLIIAAMDTPATTDLETVPLQYAVAADLAPVVQRLADSGGAAGAAGGGGGGATILVVPESRSNSLLIRASNGARMAMIKSVIQKLDRPGANGLGGSGINVVYLKNADAVKLAQILRAAFPSAGGGSGGASSSSTSAPAPTTPSASNTNNTSSSSSTGGLGSSATGSPSLSASAGPSTGGFVQADPSTNSLIITAPDALYRQLRTVIEQLDERRAQVYIETMIVEVNAEKFAEVGVQWQGLLGKQGDKNGLALGTNFSTKNVPGLISASTSLASGTAAPSLGSGLSIGVIHDFGNNQYGLAALANFLQTKADGNILSTPNLMVLDNEEAKIISGENVPFVTGQYTSNNSTSGSVNPFTTVDRKDVGLTLRVKPQIGEGGTIRMTVFQEKSDVKAGTEDKPNGPTTSKSSIETTVVVDDGTLLVLGGLIKDQSSISQSKVPLLGDAPLIGQLFRSETRSKNKTNLMVFLRPVVMRTQEASTNFTLGRYEYMRQEQREIVAPKTLLLPTDLGVMPSLTISNGTALPSMRQPLDDPKSPEPNVMLPPGTVYAPRTKANVPTVAPLAESVPAPLGTVDAVPLPPASARQKPN